MTLLEAAILGLVEGLTEFLPVSSTGHLIIASSLLGLNKDEASKDAVDAFGIAIQGGAVLAVLGLYWPRVLQMIRGLLGKNPAGLRLFRNLIIAFIPAAVLALLLKDIIKRELFYPVPVLIALGVGGVIMIFIARWQRRFYHDADEPSPHDHLYRTIEQLTWKEALIIGCIQCFALWPGTSRSMVTIVGGMLIGLKPRQAAEFSFLLALPTLGAACGYSMLKEHEGLLSLGIGPIIIGTLVAMVSAIMAVEFLVGFLNRHGFALFGWYRLVLCAVLALLVSRGMVVFS